MVMIKIYKKKFERVVGYCELCNQEIKGDSEDEVKRLFEIHETSKKHKSKLNRRKYE